MWWGELVLPQSITQGVSCPHGEARCQTWSPTLFSKLTALIAAFGSPFPSVDDHDMWEFIHSLKTSRVIVSENLASSC